MSSICDPSTSTALLPLGPIEPLPVEEPLFPEPSDAAAPIVLRGVRTRATRCQRCGGEARVRILEDYKRGAPLARHLCLECADRAYDERTRPVEQTWRNPFYAARCALAVVLVAVAVRLIVAV